MLYLKSCVYRSYQKKRYSYKLIEWTCLHCNLYSFFSACHLDGKILYNWYSAENTQCHMHWMQIRLVLCSFAFIRMEGKIFAFARKITHWKYRYLYTVLVTMITVHVGKSLWFGQWSNWNVLVRLIRFIKKK